jgi:hypothetical protein
MPVHDWTRVSAGIFHDFDQAWIIEIRNALNGGLLPAGYYALAEQFAGAVGPDVIALEETPGGDAGPDAGTSPAGIAVAVRPPKARLVASGEMDHYVRKQNRLAIRHTSDDRVVALIEIVSPGNKASRHALRSFVEKAASALFQGLHLLIVDLFPTGPRDPQGIHGAIWQEVCDDAYRQPPDQPLTLVSYSAGLVKTAYVEPVAVGNSLTDMPLFLDPEHYVEVPLEATYQAAYRGVPQRWKAVLEGGA